MLQEGAEVKHYANQEKYEATRNWIENQDLHSEQIVESDLESLAQSSVVDSSDSEYDTQTETDLEDGAVTTMKLGMQVGDQSDVFQITESIKELFNSINSVQTVGNVKIENSTGVHIGNITNINGNIQIIQAHKPPGKRTKINSKSKSTADAFIEQTKFKLAKTVCSIVPRHSWLAQMPMADSEYLSEPVEYVVILHTATESSVKQAINKRIIRDIQCFHIESRGWDDIAYNFLIGCDGLAYEGRGWGVIGAHTMGYNAYSLGISFIGCFMRELPTDSALNTCKNLLKKGIEEGHISAKYKLICHCQCTSTESPGRKLYEEIQKWEHFYKIEDEE